MDAYCAFGHAIRARGDPERGVFGHLTFQTVDEYGFGYGGGTDKDEVRVYGSRAITSTIVHLQTECPNITAWSSSSAWWSLSFQ